MQSVPVSPPPITRTSLLWASMYLPSSSRLSRRLLVLAVRKSMAKWMPFNLRPATGKSRGIVAPVASRTASDRASSSAGSRSLPTSTPVSNRMPSRSSRSTRRATTCLSSFMFGMPYMSRPPIRSGARRPSPCGPLG